MIENFENFIAENKRSKFGAAGIAIIWGTKILLVHPTGGSWQKRTLGIPKGSIEEGETELEAALRETFEETGIQSAPSSMQSVELKIRLRLDCLATVYLRLNCNLKKSIGPALWKFPKPMRR
jgi:8-oxo-dGTP pyrophosphatase MutT (NUDIX family)